MAGREKLKNELFDIAFNVHEARKVSHDLRDALGEALVTLWDVAYTKGHMEGFESGYEEGYQIGWDGGLMTREGL